MALLVVLAAGILVSFSEAATLPSWVGSTQHRWQPRLGGATWLFSRDHWTRAAAVFSSQSPRPVLVDIKAPTTGFGYRFDLNSWDSREPSYSWNPHDGSSGSAASPEDIFKIFEAAGNAEFILNLPTPRYLVENPNSYPEQSGHGYLWQTPAFYGAMVQYMFGTAGPSSEYQSLPTTLDFSSQPASFNWANLRARRGHVNPYPVVAVIIGEEPYFIDGWGDSTTGNVQGDGGALGAYSEQFRIQIRNRGITVPLGLHVRDAGRPSDPSRTWFYPMMNNCTHTDFEYLDLHHYYQYSTQLAEFKRTFPVAINPNGFEEWWTPKNQWRSDFSKFLWVVEDTRNALTDYGETPSRWKLGWSEHGIQLTSNFAYNDMMAGLHWGLWLAEGMRQNITWDAQWVLADQGWSHAQIQIRDGYLTRTPAFFVYQMAQQFHGYDLLSNNYSSAMGATNDTAKGTNLQFPWTVVRVFRDPATQRIHLFVVNQHATNTATLTGFESWAVVDWKQIHSASYSDENPLGTPGPEPIQPTTVTPTPGQPLTIQPVSISHIVLRD